VGLINGSASIPVPVPCHLSLALGATIETQFLTVGTSVSPCSLAPTLSATNRLQVTLDY
jgi:hypothetical protein